MDHGNIIVMSIMLALLLLFPLSFIHQSKSVRVTKPYLSGANTGEYDEFIGAMGTVKAMDMKDYYLEKYFGEGKLFRIGVIISLFLIAGFIAASIFVR